MINAKDLSIHPLCPVLNLPMGFIPEDCDSQDSLVAAPCPIWRTPDSGPEGRSFLNYSMDMLVLCSNFDIGSLVPFGLVVSLSPCIHFFSLLDFWWTAFLFSIGTQFSNSVSKFWAGWAMETCN